MLTVLPNAVGHRRCMRALRDRLRGHGFDVVFGVSDQDQTAFGDPSDELLTVLRRSSSSRGGFLDFGVVADRGVTAVICDGLSPFGAVVADELDLPAIVMHTTLPPKAHTRGTCSHRGHAPHIRSRTPGRQRVRPRPPIPALVRRRTPARRDVREAETRARARHRPSRSTERASQRGASRKHRIPRQATNRCSSSRRQWQSNVQGPCARAHQPQPRLRRSTPTRRPAGRPRRLDRPWRSLPADA